MGTEGPQSGQDDRPVVIGVDGSHSARAAVRAGVREARARGVGVELVLAFPWRAGDRVSAPDDFDGRAVMHLAADLVLQDLAASARRDGGGVSVSPHLLVGRPVDVLLEASRRAQLLCVGHSGSGLLLGSTTAALVQHAAAPVLVVPGPVHMPTDRSGVVVGLSGAECDRALAETALTAAEVRGCELTVVRAWEHTVPGAAGVLDPFVDPPTAQYRESGALDDLLAAVTPRHPTVPVRRVVERARAAQLLLAASLTAELVVVGHHHRAVGRLGRVASALLHRAGCTVLVVPDGTARGPAPTADRATLTAPPDSSPVS